MIRPVTLVTFLAFIGSGLYLYQVKHQAQLVDRQIRKVREATDAARARAEVLRAEYALLNDPDRLAELAATYVPDLKPTQPGQWSSMAEIDRRLPPVGGPAVEPAPLEPEASGRPEPTHAEPGRAEPTPVATRADPPRTEALRPPTRPTPSIAAAPPAEPLPPARSVSVVAAKPMPRPPASAARAPGTAVAQVLRSPPPAPLSLPRAAPFAPPAPTPAPMPAQTQAPAMPQVAAAPPPVQPRVVASLLPRVSPPPLAPAGASLLTTPPRLPPRPVGYVGPPTTTAEAVARIARGGPIDPSVPVVASALGMARTMLTVSPVSPADAGTLYPQATPR